MTGPAVDPSYDTGAWASLSRRFSPYLDLALGLTAAGFAVAALLGNDVAQIDARLEPADPLSVVATAVAGLSLVWRRTRPVGSFGVFVTGCLVVTVTFHYIGLLSVLLLFSLYSLAAHGRRRDGVLGLVLCIGIFVGAALLNAPDLRTSDLLQAWGLLVTAWALGDAIRSRRSQQASRLSAARREAAAAQELAARGIIEERLRIARELHDVVAHSMSLIAVQAGVGGHVIHTDVDAAERALEIIAETSRRALTQTRSMLGLLREQDTDPSAPPVQTIEDLDTLVEDLRQAGLSVDLEIAGARRELAPGVELTAYRVVQESLTNVLKHSGAAAAHVGLAYVEDAVDIEVTDDGNGRRASPEAAVLSGGHGLVGLQERSRLLGGSLDFGPSHDGGFRVRAHLPSRARVAQ